jgi:hypothetical protein
LLAQKSMMLFSNCDNFKINKKLGIQTGDNLGKLKLFYKKWRILKVFVVLKKR